ncbi:hypothetical protein FSP39_015901 [Pinctada imbricata]|uniref:Transmembrane protein 198 n=1 Tax=Pinctada imbricata TaxID=66713 RepID=A0AA88YVI3_PINIB|nr:hypothetical protein FSP39_015901 [Pinctada imbricata]
MESEAVHIGRKLLQTSPTVIYVEVTTNSSVTMATTTEVDVATVRSCDLIDNQYDIATAVICSMFFIFGIIYTFFGYRFFKAVMFLTGFLFTSVLLYLILTGEEYLSLEAVIGIAVGGGLLIGIVTMLVQYIGLFFTGFQLGVAIAIGVLIILHLFLPELPSKWIPFGIVMLLGVIFGALTLKFQKGGTIFGTCMIGGALMVSCIDYFIEHLALMIYIWERIRGVPSLRLCWYSWVLMGCWDFCIVVGAITQWKITGSGYDHRQAHQLKKVKKVNLQKSRQRERGDTQQSRYRHLYQARRATGDVLSQSYIQTMQQKLSPLSRRHDHMPIPTEPSMTELESANTTLTQIH